MAGAGVRDGGGSMGNLCVLVEVRGKLRCVGCALCCSAITQMGKWRAVGWLRVGSALWGW